jgi:hypothetical protein
MDSLQLVEPAETDAGQMLRAFKHRLRNCRQGAVPIPAYAYGSCLAILAERATCDTRFVVSIMHRSHHRRGALEYLE